MGPHPSGSCPPGFRSEGRVLGWHEGSDAKKSTKVRGDRKIKKQDDKERKSTHDSPGQTRSSCSGRDQVCCEPDNQISIPAPLLHAFGKPFLSYQWNVSAFFTTDSIFVLQPRSPSGHGLILTWLWLLLDICLYAKYLHETERHRGVTTAASLRNAAA